MSTPAFQPAWWCRGAHAQTLVGALIRKSPPLLLKRKRYETPDGDFLDLDFLENQPTNRDHHYPLTVILHGLEGSSRSPYVQSLLTEIARRNRQAVVVNMRMCSGEVNRRKETYHSGKTEDLDFVIRELVGERPKGMIDLVGFSIGGNIILKWLGEQGREASRMIRQAVAVSVPYDLARSVEKMDQGFNRAVYTRALLNKLKKKLSAKQRMYPHAIRYEEAKRSETFAVFDRMVTAPLNGFCNEHDYWSQSSCKNFLKFISVPTLLIHAEDDPFFPGEFLPLDHIRQSDFLEALVVPYGGHLGFIAGPWPWEPITWLEHRILNFSSERASAFMT